MKRFSFLVLFIALAIFAGAQVITGKVVDENNKALPGASIVVENTYLGTTAGADGEFSIKCKSGDCRLIISFVGFETQSIDVKAKSDNENIGKITLKTAAYMSDEVVVKATRADENSPVAYSVVDAEELRKRNSPQDLPYLLELTPSFVATSEAGTGIGYTNFRIRGTDPTRINVTVNGMPLNDAESQSVFWVNMPDFASSVNNVQITRGVGTSTNGAAAFGGSMNFFTGSLSDKPYGEISAMAGSFNTIRENISVGTGILSNGFSFDLRLSNLDSDGYVEQSFSDHQALMMTGAWRGKTSFLRFNLIHGREKTGISWWGCPEEMLETNRTYNPAGEYFDDNGNRHYYENQTDNYIQTHYQLLYSKEFGHNFDINAGIHYTRGDGYYEQYKEDELLAEYRLPNVTFQADPVISGSDTLIPAPIVITNSDLIHRKMMGNDFYGGTLAANYKTAKLKLSIGGGWNQYDGNHFGNVIWMRYSGLSEIDYEWYRNSGLKTDLNLFAKANYEIYKSLFVYGDVQFRNINYTMEGLDYDLDSYGNQRILDQEHVYNFVNPKAGLFYQISDNMNAYLSFAVANREPTRTNFKDAAGDISKTPLPETLYDYEAGYVYRSQQFSAGLNLYYMDYTDQLVPTGEKSSVGYDIMTNVAESYRAGIEIAVGVKPISKLSIDANLTLSQNKIKNFTAWAYTYDDEWNEAYEAINLGETDIAYSPNIISSGIVAYKPFAGFTLSWIAKYVGAQYFDNTSSADRKLDPYFVNNLQLDYTIETKYVKEISFKFMVNNIFNLEYSNNAYGGMWYEQGLEKTWAYYYPQAGINFMGGLALRF
ncbi:MAG: TonB-dependent receptor [Bacteroidales bacterium]|nr:TonB-dependent receptor [Bacteroidales bacterium]